MFIKLYSERNGSEATVLKMNRAARAPEIAARFGATLYLLTVITGLLPSFWLNVWSFLNPPSD